LGGARSNHREWAARLCGALVLFFLPWSAYADHLSHYNYLVLRDGEPIGTHSVTVSPEGRDFKVEAETDLAVKFGPLTLYHLEHQRREIWRDGELEKMIAHTDKNGDIYDIAITREPQGYKRVINGRTDRFDSSVKVLTLWHDDLFKYTSFLSPMEDKTYKISVDFVGADRVDLIDRSVDALEYRISGDTNRELWYDADGHIMKVSLLDHDSRIDYVLTSINGAPFDARYLLHASSGPHPPVAKLAARR
jgi:Domain of unknown function (DUF6134)